MFFAYFKAFLLDFKTLLQRIGPVYRVLTEAQIAFKFTQKKKCQKKGSCGRRKRCIR